MDGVRIRRVAGLSKRGPQQPPGDLLEELAAEAARRRRDRQGRQSVLPADPRMMHGGLLGVDAEAEGLPVELEVGSQVERARHGAEGDGADGIP